MQAMQASTWKRRSVLSWLAAASGAVLVAACGGTSPASSPASTTRQSSSQSSSQSSASAQPAATAPAKSGGVTIEYWSFFPSDNSRFSERPALFAEYKQKSGNTIQADFVQDAQMDTKVQTGFAAKQLPDFADPPFTDQPIGWGRQGIVIELTDVLNSLGKDDFAKPLVNALTYKGKVYAIPWMTNPQLMFYRKDWAADKGLKIGSWDEWLTFAKTFTGQNPAGKAGYGQGGFMAPVHQAPWIQDFLGPNNGETFDEKWNVVLDTLEANQQSFDFMKRLSQYFQPGAINNNYGDTNNLFTDEVIAIALSSTTFVNGVIKNKPNLIDKIGIQPIPQGPSGKGNRGAYLGCYSFTIFSTSQHKEETKNFFSWIFDPAVYIRCFKTIDFGHVPVRVSVATDPKLATLIPPLAQDDVKAGISAAQIATLTGQDFGPNPLARQISAQNIWSSAAQKVLTGPSNDALKWAADEIRKIVKDDPSDLG